MKEPTLEPVYCCRSECDHCPYDFKRPSPDVPSEFCDSWDHPAIEEEEETED